MSVHTSTDFSVGSSSFSGPGHSDKAKFIKQAKGTFKDQAKETAGRKIAEGRRGAGKNPTNGGVSQKAGYRTRSEPGYVPSPGASIHGS